jgi:hypothetical protein
VARTTATNFTGPLQYPIATAATDIFKKEDLQTLAQAVDQHDHTAGKGLSVAPANASITNAKLASDTARANLLTNGSFDVWQRGPGPFSIAGGFTSADRWLCGAVSGTDTFSVSKDTTNMDAASGSKTCAAATYGLGTGGGLYFINQVGNDAAQIANRVLSLSMRVRTSSPNAVRLTLYTGSAFVYSAYHSGGGAYETLTLTATMGSGAQAGNAGVYFTASCTAYLDNAMLVVGSVPADYAPLHPADDLARCLRYYEALAPNTPMLVGQATTTLGAYVPYAWQVAKAVTPTVTVSAPSSWSLSSATATGALVATAVSVTVQTVASCLLGIAVASGTVAGNAVIVQAASAGQFANVEANP